MNTPHFDHLSVCAVVVTWNIGPALVENIEATLPQVDKAVIVDNGSDMETLHVIHSLEARFPDKIFIIRNPANTGLAGAQNQGIAYAADRGFQWVLILDHDSTPAPGMVLEMLTVFRHLNREDVALLAPNIRDRNTCRTYYYLKPGFAFLFEKVTFAENKYIEDILLAIASGSLIRVEAIRKIGFFNEKFFIDYIDTEFCLRLRKYGYAIVAVRDGILEHTLGEISTHFLGDIEVNVTNHSTKRRFTIFRNRSFLWRKYWKLAPAFVFFDFLAAWYELIKIVLFEKQRPGKIFNALHGLYKGRTLQELKRGPF